MWPGERWVEAEPQVTCHGWCLLWSLLTFLLPENVGWGWIRGEWLVYGGHLDLSTWDLFPRGTALGSMTGSLSPSISFPIGRRYL